MRKNFSPELLACGDSKQHMPNMQIIPQSRFFRYVLRSDILAMLYTFEPN